MSILAPLEAAILVAVAKGVDSVEELAELLRVSKDDVEKVVEKLVEKGLIIVEEKRILVFKRRKLKLTTEGFNLLPEAEKVLRSIAEKMRKAYECMKEGMGSTRSVNHLPLSDEELVLIPFLAWLDMLPFILVLELLPIEFMLFEDIGQG